MCINVKEMNLKYHQDIAHGWLEVPLKALMFTNFSPSCFSYIDVKNKRVFLEEDCDASGFISNYYAKTGHRISTDDVTPIIHDDLCFIRELDSIDIKKDILKLTSNCYVVKTDSTSNNIEIE